MHELAILTLTSVLPQLPSPRRRVGRALPASVWLNQPPLVDWQPGCVGSR